MTIYTLILFWGIHFNFQGDSYYQCGSQAGYLEDIMVKEYIDIIVNGFLKLYMKNVFSYIQVSFFIHIFITQIFVQCDAIRSEQFENGPFS